MVTGISNAETVTVTAPSTYTDGNLIVGNVVVTVYQGTLCTGAAYGTVSIPSGGTGTIIGTALTCQGAAYLFVGDARIGTGTPSVCSVPFSYLFACSTTPRQPGITNIVR